jgi:hypothetical protein
MFYIYVDAFKVTMIKNKYFKLIKRYLTFKEKKDAFI